MNRYSIFKPFITSRRQFLDATTFQLLILKTPSRLIQERMLSQERSLPSLSIQRDMWGPKCYSFVRFDNIQCECLLAIIIVEPKLAQFEVTVIPKSLVHNFQQVRANVCNFLLIEQKVCILSCSIYSYSPSYFMLTGYFFD